MIILKYHHLLLCIKKTFEFKHISTKKKKYTLGTQKIIHWGKWKEASHSVEKQEIYSHLKKKNFVKTTYNVINSLMSRHFCERNGEESEFLEFPHCGPFFNVGWGKLYAYDSCYKLCYSYLEAFKLIWCGTNFFLQSFCSICIQKQLRHSINKLLAFTHNCDLLWKKSLVPLIKVMLKVSSNTV